MTSYDDETGQGFRIGERVRIGTTATDAAGTVVGVGGAFDGGVGRARLMYLVELDATHRGYLGYGGPASPTERSALWVRMIVADPRSLEREAVPS